MEKTITIKQDYYGTAEEFKNALRNVMYAILDFARRGEEVSFSSLANDLYPLEYLLRDAEITVE